MMSLLLIQDTDAFTNSNFSQIDKTKKVKVLSIGEKLEFEFTEFEH